MFPNKLLELKNSGDKFVQSGNFEEAIKCYKEAIDLNPDYSAVWNNMGYVYSKLGKTEEARNCKEKINEIKNKKEAVKDDSNLSTNIQIDSMNKSLAEKTESPEVKTKLQNTKENIFKKIQIRNGIQTISKTFTEKSLGVLDSIGETITTERRRIAYNLMLRNHKIHIKKLIIADFDLKELKKMCVYFDIGEPNVTRTDSRGYSYRVRPTYDDWSRFVFKRIELANLREYARLHYKLSSKILEIERKYKKERIEKYSDYEQDDGKLSYGSDIDENPLLLELINVIRGYQPIKFFKNEELYHTNLYTYLCEKIPGDIGFEVQRGSSRPDIVVGDIAIEIKGPTDNQGLVTIADKINRYSQHFEHIIVVLFDVQTLERFYNEWHEGIKRQYGDLVTIIRK